MKNFISAHNHPESRLTASKIDSFINKTKELGLNYISFADHGHMMSSLKCYMESTKKGLKPILGVELFFKDIDCDLIKGSKSEQSKYFTITVHALDQESFQALSKLVSRTSGLLINIDDRSYPSITWNDLQDISKYNVTAIIGGPNCMVAKHSLVSRGDISIKYFDRLNSIFKDRLYISLVPIKLDKSWKSIVRIKVSDKYYTLLGSDRVETNAAQKIRATELSNYYRHNFIKSVYINKIRFKVNKPLDHAIVENNFTGIKNGDILEKVNKLLYFLSKNRKMGDKLLLSTYSYYAYPQDKIVQDMKLGDSSRFYAEYSMKSSEEVKDYLLKLGMNEDEFKNAIENTHNYSELFSNFKLSFSPRLPECDGDPYERTLDLVNKLGRMDWNNSRYVDRFNQEISVLRDNGTINLLPYALPIAKIYDIYRDSGLLTGPGRGSAAGSLISYLIGITHVDPLKYELSFYRYFSPARAKMGNIPDIDSDLCDKKYLQGILQNLWPNKWAQASTRGMMRLKSSILDANRFSNKGEVESDIEKLSKSLPAAPQGISDSDFVFGYENEDGEHVDGLIDVSSDLKKYSEQRPSEWDIVKRSLGIVRQPGRHASAVFITDKEINELIATFFMSSTKVVQPEAKHSEFAGLIKYDFLGLNTLNIIQSTLKHINNKNKEDNIVGYFSHNGSKTFVWDLPDDENVYNSISAGQTETLFQLNTKSMLPYVLGIKPKNINDLATISALVRPGPLDFVDESTGRNMAEEYIERRNGRSIGRIQALNDLLPETYGSIVFQEQLTKICIELAGMEPEEAENVRIATGKKRIKDLQALKPIFVEGASKKVSVAEANEIWNMMEKFGRYGFNKSHAVCYSVITYATAFLKHHYPLEYWSAVLTHESEEVINQHLIKYVRDIIRPPDINTSQKEMAPDYTTNTIRQRLTLLKGMGDKQSDKIIANRPYTDIKDFIRRGECSNSLAKKLAHVGVLDSLFELNTSTEKKILLINQAVIDIEYEDKIASGKKPKAKKQADVDLEYVGLDSMTDYQIKKSIFPTMNYDLHSITMSGSGRVNPHGKYPICTINNSDYRYVSGNAVSKIDSTDVENEVTVACVGYVINTSEFTYQSGSKKALKIFLDCSGYVSEKVLWPSRETGKLDYPKTLKKGAVVLVSLNKRPGKPYTNIVDIEVIKESLDKDKKKK
jgi:DNA-directed DNA polymerase III PolC